MEQQENPQLFAIDGTDLKTHKPDLILQMAKLVTKQTGIEPIITVNGEKTFFCDYDGILHSYSMVKALSHTFSDLLASSLTSDQMERVIGENRESSDALICASHDYIDVNTVMSDAFHQVYGRPVNPLSANDRGAWALAWKIAKGNEFYIDEQRQRGHGMPKR